MKNIFETILILRPDMDTELIKKTIDTYTESVQSYSHSKKVKVENIGKKKLAYVLRDKYKYGYYAIFTYEATVQDAKELEKAFEKDKKVLKYITVTIDNDDTSQLKDLEKLDAYDILFGLV